MSDAPPGTRFTFLDYVGLGFILIGGEEILRRPREGWPIWIPGFVLGLVALMFRDRNPQLVDSLLAWFRAPKKKTKEKAEPEQVAAITGNADLLLTRLEAGDMYLDHGEMAINQGVFVRMLVAARDRPRTVKKFSIEVRIIQAGNVEPEVRYTAESEREVGEYLHRYDKSHTNSLGYVVEKTVEEPMQDILKLLRVPLRPDTHVEGWVRFELKGVKHELNGCHITIYAIDATDHRYEIEAAGMRVVPVEAHEYAFHRDRRDSL